MADAKRSTEHNRTIEEIDVLVQKTQEEIGLLAKSLHEFARETRDSIKELSSRMADQQRAPWSLLISGSVVILAIVGLAGNHIASDLYRVETNQRKIADEQNAHRIDPKLHYALEERSDALEKRISQDESVSAGWYARILDHQIQAASLNAKTTEHLRALEREAFGPPSRIDKIEAANERNH